MITTHTLRRQVWMADDDEFNYIVKNTQRVLKLNAQYENHPYVEEFTEEFSVMFVYRRYLSEEEADANFFFWGGEGGDIWNLFQVCFLPNNANKFSR